MLHSTHSLPLFTDRTCYEQTCGWERIANIVLWISTRRIWLANGLNINIFRFKWKHATCWEMGQILFAKQKRWRTDASLPSQTSVLFFYLTGTITVMWLLWPWTLLRNPHSRTDACKEAVSRLSLISRIGNNVMETQYVLSNCSCYNTNRMIDVIGQ